VQYSVLELVDTENCFSFKNDCNSGSLIGQGWEQFRVTKILSFQLKSAFSTLTLHSVRSIRVPLAVTCMFSFCLGPSSPRTILILLRGAGEYWNVIQSADTQLVI